MTGRVKAGLRMLATTGAVSLLLGCATAWATEFDMVKLPVTEPYLCLACHTHQAPTNDTAALNPFGLDFLANGRVWDLDLASLDSDGDGCLNGVEIGDADGDGRPDGNIDEQTGNPGVVDECGSGSLVDEKLWGSLKAMFDQR